MKFILALTLLAVYSTNLLARTNFTTTHLKSTAGAGVASIFLEESAFLNPAPIAFMQRSSISYTKTTSDTKNQAGLKTKGPKNWGLVIADSNPSVSGAVSYFVEENKNMKAKRYSGTMATPMGKQSSMGITYSKNEYKDLTQDLKYSQVDLGVLHIISESVYLGFLANNILNNDDARSRATLGVNYVYKNFITLILDLGANYKENLKSTFFYKSGIKFKLFTDIYLRAGFGRDTELHEEVSSVGLAWEQPKLFFDFAIQNTNFLSASSVNKDLKETSFSVGYRF